MIKNNAIGRRNANSLPVLAVCLVSDSCNTGFGHRDEGSEMGRAPRGAWRPVRGLVSGWLDADCEALPLA